MTRLTQPGEMAPYFTRPACIEIKNNEARRTPTKEACHASSICSRWRSATGGSMRISIMPPRYSPVREYIIAAEQWHYWRHSICKVIATIQYSSTRRWRWHGRAAIYLQSRRRQPVITMLYRSLRPCLIHLVISRRGPIPTSIYLRSDWQSSRIVLP